MGDYTGWTNTGGDAYSAAIDTVPTLPAGLYTTVATPQGLFFVYTEVSDRDILRFPDAPIDKVVTELEDFWTKGENFKRHGLPHKRGILMYGPPGSGKSCTIQLIVNDVIERGGLVFIYSSSFANAYRTLREVEADRPLVVLMEDLDSIITPNNESAILQHLDGIAQMHRVVFVATTNYPEKLPERLTNRPSRFDRRVLVDHPSEDARRMYLESLVMEGDVVDVEAWVKDTAGFSLAHLKELFVSVCILENGYDEALKTLRLMADKAKSTDSANFARGQYV